MSMARRARLAAAAVVALAVATACERGKSPAAPDPVCTFAIAPASQSVEATGGSATVTVTAGAGCAWTAASAAAWLAVTSGATGSGPGVVTYEVAANPSTEPRTTTLTVAGHGHAVAQKGRVAPACAFTLSPVEARFGSDAGSGTFAVETAPGCDWQAASSASWLRVVSGAGPGPGAVSYSVARNTAVTGRSATITVAGQSFRVIQSGDVGSCEYSVAPVTFSPCMPAGTSVAAITTTANCPWTATASVGWLTVTGGASGEGSGQVTVRYGDNYDAPREGVVMVRWPTPTAGQNIRIAQAGCVYALSQTALEVAAAGTTATVNVVQQAVPSACGGPLQDRCVWTARSDVSWIVITSSMPRAGDNPVSFRVDPNAGSAPRTGRVTVRDQALTVTQAGQ